MHRFGRTAAARWALGALIVVAATASVAWAAESMTRETPAVDPFTATAVVAPAGGSAEVLGKSTGPHGMDDETTLFSARLDGPSGCIYVNGQACGSFEPDRIYSVVSKCERRQSDWVVSTVVIDEMTQEIVAEHLDHPMADRPTSVTAVAASVIDLIVE